MGYDVLTGVLEQLCLLEINLDTTKLQQQIRFARYLMLAELDFLST